MPKNKSKNVINIDKDAKENHRVECRVICDANRISTQKRKVSENSENTDQPPKKSQKADKHNEHTDFVTLKKLSRNKRLLAFAYTSGKVVMYAGSKGDKVGELVDLSIEGEFAHGGSVFGLTWSPDDSRIATASGDKTVKIWNVVERALTKTITFGTSIADQQFSLHWRNSGLFSISVVGIVHDLNTDLGTISNRSAIHPNFRIITLYSSTNSCYVSAFVNGRIVMYVGSFEVGELSDPSVSGGYAHNGIVFDLVFSPDSSRLATTSSDQKIKIWNLKKRSLEKSILIGRSIEDQQLSISWSKNGLRSFSLGGVVKTLFEKEESAIFLQHEDNTKMATCAFSQDKKYLIISERKMTRIRELATGSWKQMIPMIHGAYIVGIFHTAKGEVISVGEDCTIKTTFVSTENSIRSVKSVSNSLPSQPLGLAVSADGSVAVVACYQHVAIQSNGNLTSIGIKFNASSAAISPDKTLVAIGGQDNRVYIYKLSGGQLNEINILNHTGAITAVAFSPNGQHLAVTDSARKVVPYSVSKDFVTDSAKEWKLHTEKVNCVAWSPDGNRLATGGLDTSIIIWDLKKSGDHPIIIKGAHEMDATTGIVWLNRTKIMSVGTDATVKNWTIPLHV